MYSESVCFYTVAAHFSSRLMLSPSLSGTGVPKFAVRCSIVQHDFNAGHANSVHTGTEASASAYPFRKPTVSVFWDLDNKPPKASPYHAALYLRYAASQFGSIVDMVAFANRHAFLHVPEWARRERQERKRLDVLEQKGIVTPEQPYVCRMCGRKCKTNLHLKRHFKQLHEREQHKRISRLNSLKGKKKAKYRESISAKTHKYKEAARPILLPKSGIGLESDLRRAGVYVRTVQFKPQAADVALKQRIAESMNRGVKCICLVSDDTDFAEMLTNARAQNLETIVFGESRSLKRFADFWFPWDDIHQGVRREQFEGAVQAWIQGRQKNQQNRQAFGGSQPMSLGYDPGSTMLDGSDVQHRVFPGGSPVPKSHISSFSEEEAAVEEEDVLYFSDLDYDEIGLSDEDLYEDSEEVSGDFGIL